jgi:hypothetical protein
MNMTEDADRHVLGDPISRMMPSAHQPPSVTDDRPAGDLSDVALRREVANLALISAEAPLRGVAPETLRLVERRLTDLRAELVRRGQAFIGDHVAGEERSGRGRPA